MSDIRRVAIDPGFGGYKVAEATGEKTVGRVVPSLVGIGQADDLGLAALLNSKYRSKTFDFLGNGMIARAVQESFRTGGWDPFSTPSPDMPESIPVITRRPDHLETP